MEAKTQQIVNNGENIIEGIPRVDDKHNISCVVTSKLCHSCGACFAACNTDSINFVETVGGNVFPEVNLKNCNHCGRCYNVCPSIHFGNVLTTHMPDNPFVGKILNTYVGKATNDTIFWNSQSGGVVTALLNYLLQNGQISAAVVATMRPGTPPRGTVILAKSMDELLASQKSKYTPIPILMAIKEIKNIEGRIAIVGLSCHMHGLCNILDIFPALNEKIAIKIGLICDRVMTNASIDFLAARATSDKITNILFRDKRQPSYPGNVVVETTDGKRIILDEFERRVIKDFFTPARCRLCFDKMNVFSDVVVGDPHGIIEIDRHSGESLVLVRTTKGEELLNQVISNRDVNLRPISADEAIHGQHISEKMEMWESFVTYWVEDKRVLPTYLSKMSKSRRQPTKKQVILLKRAIGLDDFKNRGALIQHYRNKVIILIYKKNILNAISFFINKVIRIYEYRVG